MGEPKQEPKLEEPKEEEKPQVKEEPATEEVKQEEASGSGGVDASAGSGGVDAAVEDETQIANCDSNSESDSEVPHAGCVHVRKRRKHSEPWEPCTKCGYLTFVNRHFWCDIGIPVPQGYCVYCNNAVPHKPWPL